MFFALHQACVIGGHNNSGGPGSVGRHSGLNIQADLATRASSSRVGSQPRSRFIHLLGVVT